MVDEVYQRENKVASVSLPKHFICKQVCHAGIDAYIFFEIRYLRVVCFVVVHLEPIAKVLCMIPGFNEGDPFA